MTRSDHPADKNNECVVELKHMMSIFDSHTWQLGCSHRKLAVITANMVDQVVLVSLLLEHKTVEFVYDRGRTTITEIPYPQL